MVRTTQYANQFWYSEQGQDLVEYSLIVAFVAVVSFGIIGIVFPGTKYIWVGANVTLSTAASAAS
jgi:Flp pilus assembly pilin Flp